MAPTSHPAGPASRPRPARGCWQGPARPQHQSWGLQKLGERRGSLPRAARLLGEVSLSRGSRCAPAAAPQALRAVAAAPPRGSWRETLRGRGHPHTQQPGVVLPGGAIRSCVGTRRAAGTGSERQPLAALVFSVLKALGSAFPPSPPRFLHLQVCTCQPRVGSWQPAGAPGTACCRARLCSARHRAAAGLSACLRLPAQHPAPQLPDERLPACPDDSAPGRRCCCASQLCHSCAHGSGKAGTASFVSE